MNIAPPSYVQYQPVPPLNNMNAVNIPTNNMPMQCAMGMPNTNTAMGGVPQFCGFMGNNMGMNPTMMQPQQLGMQPPTIVINQQPNVVPAKQKVDEYSDMQFYSESVICPHCNASIKTQVKCKPLKRAFLAACILCCCGVCFVPFCIPCCYQIDHYCPSCNKFIGEY